MTKHKHKYRARYPNTELQYVGGSFNDLFCYIIERNEREDMKGQ